MKTQSYSKAIDLACRTLSHALAVALALGTALLMFAGHYVLSGLAMTA